MGGVFVSGDSTGYDAADIEVLEGREGCSEAARDVGRLDR